MRRIAVTTGIALVVAGAAAGVALLAGGCQPKPTPPDQRVQHAKAIVTDLRRTFEGGKLFEGSPQEDARMLLVVGILKKVHFGTIRKELDETRRQAILARLDETIKTTEGIAADWQQAVNGRRNAAAKDLVPRMQELETQLDQVIAVLQGDTP